MASGVYEKWYRNLCDKVSDACKQANKEYARHLENTFRDNYARIITDWYAAYTPAYYHRRGSLYHLIRFSHTDTSFSVDFDPSRISRRDGANGERDLYYTVFKLGYHGGAFFKESGGFYVPYTAPPSPYYGEAPWDDPKPWEIDPSIGHGWKPAERSISPFRVWKSYIDKYNKKQYQTDYDNILDKYIRNLF